MKTATSIVKRKYLVNKEQVLLCTGLDKGTYNTIVHDTAIEWIKHSISSHQEDIQRLTRTPLFWKWWINQWNIRDEVFLYDYIGFIISSEDFTVFLLDAWQGVHNVRLIDKYPSTEMVQQLYSDVMRGNIRQIQNEINQPSKSKNNENTR